jgi:hypothetical protein
MAQAGSKCHCHDALVTPGMSILVMSALFTAHLRLLGNFDMNGIHNDILTA